MKLNFIPIIALLSCSHFALAEGTTQAPVTAKPKVATVQQPVEKATAKQIKSLETDVGSSLQSKLDTLMSIDAAPEQTSRQKVANAH